jgi:hypothetical protein
MSKFDLLMKKHPIIKQTLTTSNEKRIKGRLHNFDNKIKFQEDRNNYKTNKFTEDDTGVREGLDDNHFN